MILVVGGIHSGRKTFVREALGYGDAAFVDAARLAHDSAPRRHAGRAAVGCEELVRTHGVEEALALLAGFDVVVVRLVGAGVVPVSRDDAAWRERVGRLGCVLAARADVVVRMVCGIPEVIKGDLAGVCDGSSCARATASTLDVVLVRHGETASTPLHRYSGAGTDEPLSPEGARALSEREVDASVDRVITSGMIRAFQTARILYPNAGVAVCPGLREMDFGAFEGKTAADMEGDARYRAWVDAWCEPRCPGGEGKEAFARRVVSAFRAACEEEAASGRERAVFVVHAGTIRAILSELAIPKRGYFDVHTKPGGAWRGTWNGTSLEGARPVGEGPAR